MPAAADRVYWEVLVVRCQLGDHAAFGELVAQCQPRLRGFLHKLLAGRHNLDDLTQEIWTDVLRDLPKLRDPGAFVPWFYRIARNRAFRLLRQSRESVGSLDDVDPIDSVDEPDEPDFSAEEAQAVHAALDQLSPEHREMLLLKFMEEMSYEQIAEAVGCQLGTVRSRIHNAKKQLRSILERQANDGRR